MTTGIKLIVGLANPGKPYQDTRHNAGAWFVEALCRETNTSLRHEAKFHGACANTNYYHSACHILIPSTFINLSGLAVRALSQYLKLTPDQILIAHDDIDLPAGTVKLKLDGGDGGHNGLKDIIRHLNTKAFYRLRIGVGRPTRDHDVADYVLHAPSKVDRALIDENIQDAIAVLPLILAGNIAKAMQELHTPRD